MNGEPSIPPKVREILASTPITGTRHTEMKGLAMSLIGNGLDPDAVFVQLRKRYPEDVHDIEIANVINWASEKNPGPSIPVNAPKGPVKTGFQTVRKPVEVATRCPDLILETKQLLRAPAVQEKSILKKSEPIPDWPDHLSHLLCGCYELKEEINIVTQYTMRDAKANPMGNGTILTIDQWIDRGISGSDAGGWMRMNPVSGGIADEHVTAFRFVLLESDSLPPAQQLGLLASLPLPISAILWSGGLSYHAWVRVDCPDLETYRKTSTRLLGIFGKLGFDQGNKNPSRLSRLPGVERKIGASSDGRQRLVYLNSNPTTTPIIC